VQVTRWRNEVAAPETSTTKSMQDQASPTGRMRTGDRRAGCRLSERMLRLVITEA